jgi:hypothetical protein
MNREHAERVYFEQLKRAVSIEVVLARYGIELKRQGASLKGPCPIHRWFAISSGPPNNQHSTRRSRAMSEGSKPSHKAFVVEGEGDSAFWTRCGSAWPHKDGKGLNVQLPTGLAVSGRLVLREYTEEDVKEEEQQKSSRRKK